MGGGERKPTKEQGQKNSGSQQTGAHDSQDSLTKTSDGKIAIGDNVEIFTALAIRQTALRCL